jgi:peptide/nickel transport system permease protein
MVSVLIFTAVAAPLLAPHDPLTAVADCFGEPLSPRQGFWFGTDELGRDMLSRILFGARISLLVAFCATAIALTIGVTVGIFAGYMGGWTDLLLMRLTDVMLAFPALLLVVAMSAVLQPGLTSIFVVIGLVSWTTVARTVRAEVLSLRKRDFITASVSLGNRPGRILVRHILPNVLPTIVIMAALGTSSTILLDAGLSYLGLGVPVPTPSWGRMIADSRTYYRIAPWLMLFPGMAIVFAVMAFNFLGYGLLAILDPRSGRRAGAGKS